MTAGWPVTLREGRVALRPITRSDRDAWTSVRANNRDWLAPWEATPPRDVGPPMTFPAMVRNLRKDLETCQTKHHDAGTADFLTGLMEKHEKTAWMLRATAEGKAL